LFPRRRDATFVVVSEALTTAETNPSELPCSLRASGSPLHSIQIHPGISAMASVLAYGCDSPELNRMNSNGFFVL
jgi:hypothetical protein